jgi:hypothetical protein
MVAPVAGTNYVSNRKTRTILHVASTVDVGSGLVAFTDPFVSHIVDPSGVVCVNVQVATASGLIKSDGFTKTYDQTTGVFTVSGTLVAGDEILLQGIYFI